MWGLVLVRDMNPLVAFEGPLEFPLTVWLHEEAFSKENPTAIYILTNSLGLNIIIHITSTGFSPFGRRRLDTGDSRYRCGYAERGTATCLS